MSHELPNSLITHVLFDFFGTLVDYSPSRIEQGYRTTHQVVRSFSAAARYDEFLQLWTAVSSRFDCRSASDGREYSMTELAAAVLTEFLGRDPTEVEARDLADAYLADWSTGVVHPRATASVVATIGRTHRLAVVSNTNEADLVPRHLAEMGIADRFDAVITSVEVGWRKPHPAIYQSALTALGITASAAVFVGDSHDADYLGPEAAGITAYLIDPQRRHDVPEERRLDSLADLPARLGLA